MNETNASAERGCQAVPTRRLNNTTQFVSTVANCTRVSYSEPPETAAMATQKHFETLEPGDEFTSRYPRGATLTQTETIADAHATVYALHPATRLQTTQNASTLLIAPDGVVRALIDYRLPSTLEAGTVRTHYVDSVRLLYNGEVLDERQSPTQKPRLEYHDLPRGPAVMTVEATIRVVHEVSSPSSSPSPSEGSATTEREVTTITVTDQRHVLVTDVSQETVEIRQVRSPTGERLLSVGHPFWNRLSVTSEQDAQRNRATGSETERSTSNNSTTTVYNGWRFHTEADESWTRLHTATSTGVESKPVETAPRYVSAVPLGEFEGPQYTSPIRGDVRGVVRWSEPLPLSSERQVSHGPLDAGSSETSGVTLTMESGADLQSLQVSGLVRGTNASIDLRDSPVEATRQPNLSLTVLSQNDSAAILRVSLRDEQTDAPIVVSVPSERSPTNVHSSADDDMLFVNGQPVATDERGEVVVTIDEYGPQSARFSPGRVTTSRTYPAYSAVATTVAWHPLMSGSGVARFVLSLLKWGLFGLVLLYAGRRLGRFFHPREYL